MIQTGNITDVRFTGVSTNLEQVELRIYFRILTYNETTQSVWFFSFIYVLAQAMICLNLGIFIMNSKSKF